MPTVKFNGEVSRHTTRGCRPIYFKPYYSVFKGELCEGVQIHILDYKVARLSEVQFLVVQEMMRLCFSNESALRISRPKYWSFSPSNEYSGLISLRIDWFYLLAVQGTLKSLLQHHNSKAQVEAAKLI